MTTHPRQSSPALDPDVDAAQGPLTASASPDEEADRVGEALTELGGLSKRAGEKLIVKLLEGVENESIPLSALLGYSDDDVYQLYERGYSLYENGHPKLAGAVARGILALSPGLPPAQLLLAICQMDLSNVEDALRILDEVLAIDPEEAEAHLKKGHVLYRMGRIAEAAQSMRDSVALDPDRETAEGEEAALILEYLVELMEAPADG